MGAQVSKPRSFNLFIDTNYLSDMILYTDFCESNRIDLFKEKSESIDLNETRRKRSFDIAKGVRENVKDGKKIIQALSHGTKRTEITLSYSKFNEIELRGLIARSLLFSEAIRAHVPDRIANHVVLGSGAKKAYLSSIAPGIDRLKEILMEHSVTMECCDDYSVDPSSIPQILNVVEAVQRNIVMGSFDLYLYSCALYLQADAILTRDGEFRNVIQSLRSPPRDSGWIEVRKRILSDSERFVIRPLKSDSINNLKMNFPRPFGPGDLRKHFS